MITLIGGRKLTSLLALLETVRHLDGAIAEMGVFQGGSLKAMADAVPGKTCFGFDTFTGHPAASWQEGDFHQPGEFGDTTYDDVLAAMPANVVLKRGLFPSTAKKIDAQFCFAHVDFDLERSTDDAIKWLMPRMVSGGLIVFDDYKWRNCEGVLRAIERAGLAVVESTVHQCYWTAP